MNGLSLVSTEISVVPIHPIWFLTNDVGKNFIWQQWKVCELFSFIFGMANYIKVWLKYTKIVSVAYIFAQN